MPQGEMGGAPNQGQQNNQGQVPPQSGASDVKVEAKSLVNQLEALLDEYMVKKAPFTLPLGGKEFVAGIAPYLIIIAAVLAVPALLLALGFSTVFAPAAMMGGYNWGFMALVSVAFSLAAFVVELMAVPGLFKRTKRGWRLVFYAGLISLVGSILSLHVISAIIGAIIGWYFLFQVKELYKN